MSLWKRWFKPGRRLLISSPALCLSIFFTQMADLGLTPDEIKSLSEFSSQPSVRPFVFYNHRHINPILNAPVLSVYDVCLSFPKELKCIWQRKLRTAGVLYLIIRYGTIHIALSRVLDSFYISSTIAVSRALHHSNPAHHLDVSFIGVLSWSLAPVSSKLALTILLGVGPWRSSLIP